MAESPSRALGTELGMPALDGGQAGSYPADRRMTSIQAGCLLGFIHHSLPTDLWVRSHNALNPKSRSKVQTGEIRTIHWNIWEEMPPWRASVHPSISSDLPPGLPPKSIMEEYELKKKKRCSIFTYRCVCVLLETECKRVSEWALVIQPRVYFIPEL